MILQPPMDRIPEFTNQELEVARAVLAERYACRVEPDLAESELRLDRYALDLVSWPTLDWNERGGHFGVFKTAPSRYRCQVFHRIREVFGTGLEEYDDLGDCILTLLRVQSDHERERDRGREPARP